MPDKNNQPRVMDYLHITPIASTSPQDKALYEKYKAIIKECFDKFAPIVITSSYRSRSVEMNNYLKDESLKGLDYMHISGSRSASVDSIMASVLRAEKAIEEGKLRNTPKAVDDVPGHVKLIMLKTRLGENNGI